MSRFDPHRPANNDKPQVDPDGRTVIYVGEDLATSACEVFGETQEAAICPAYRVALIQPIGRLRFFDLSARGSAMAIGGLPSLGSGPIPRQLTAEWARAIYEDHPLGHHVDGIKYDSGYHYGRALAIWDSAGKIDLPPGVGMDMPLNHAGMLAKLKVDLIDSQIRIKEISAAECALCP